MERIEFKGLQFEEVSLDSFGEVEGWFENYLDILSKLNISWAGVLELNSVGFVWNFLLPAECKRTLEYSFIDGILEYSTSTGLTYEQYCKIPDHESCIGTFTEWDIFKEDIKYLLKDNKMYRRI